MSKQQVTNTTGSEGFANQRQRVHIERKHVTIVNLVYGKSWISKQFCLFLELHWDFRVNPVT